MKNPFLRDSREFSSEREKIFSSIAQIQQSSKKYLAENNAVSQARALLERADRASSEAKLHSVHATREETSCAIVRTTPSRNALKLERSTYLAPTFEARVSKQACGAFSK
jgi:hypothetical protein